MESDLHNEEEADLGLNPKRFALEVFGDLVEVLCFLSEHWFEGFVDFDARLAQPLAAVATLVNHLAEARIDLVEVAGVGVVSAEDQLLCDRSVQFAQQHFGNPLELAGRGFSDEISHEIFLRPVLSRRRAHRVQELVHVGDGDLHA